MIKSQNSSGLSLPTISQSTDFEMKKNYFLLYISHLSIWTGILFLCSVFGVFLLVFQKNFKKGFIFGFSYIFIFGVIVFKGFLFHTRYVFILYPIIILLGVYAIFYFYELFKKKFPDSYSSIQYLILVVFLLIFPGKYTFFPQTFYEIDYSSPQPNFKEAYTKISKNAEVISGFPVLCEWYFGEKGNCSYALAVDYVGDKEKNFQEKILKRGKDNYTNLKYLYSLDDLKDGKTYYFVIDKLTKTNIIQKEVMKKLEEKGEIIYKNGEKYNEIEVIVFKK
ncbi:hypothetical protein KGV52_01750 [Candidatus Gracilibacteria bacterium]|nr:hypothetical protein [Candidatus Gracilibacteria bacterium]